MMAVAGGITTSSHQTSTSSLGNRLPRRMANAAQTATIQAGFIAASGATLVEFATPDETIQAVRNGEADAVLADGDYLMPIVGESNGELAVVGQESIIVEEETAKANVEEWRICSSKVK